MSRLASIEPRSLLFVPGNQPRMYARAAGTRPDVFVPDLEDSVADADKEQAREILLDNVAQLVGTGIPVVPRINALNTPWFRSDLDAVAGCGIAGISIGKVDSPADMRRLTDALVAVEHRRGLRAGTLGVIPWLESAAAVLQALEICHASPRLAAVAFGAEDFCNDMGIARTDGEQEVEVPRRLVAMAARAAGVPALDTPYFAFRNEQGLRSAAAASRAMGFRGRFAIHPAQIEPLNECFSPTAEEIEHARRVVAAFEAAAARGRGSTSLDGQVIDVPVVKRARALLARAERAI